jgi:hypothetical protein
MNITSLFDSLSTRLALLKEKLNIENAVNDYGLNITLENTFIDVLNIVYNLNLVNANTIKANFPAIDAIDNENAVVFQITSTFSKAKIIASIKKAIENDIHKTHKHLKFFFLKDTGRLSKNTLQEIQETCKGYFECNPDKDFIDSGKLFQQLFVEQNLDKTISVISKLDLLLGTLPIGKTSSFNAVAISFAPDEADNTFLLIDRILREGINVFITSKTVYNKFQEHQHRFIEYLVLVNDALELSHIKNYIVVLSSQHINKNLKNEVECQFLKQLIKNDLKTKVISFNPFIKNISDIKLRRFKSYISLTTDQKRLNNFTKTVFKDFFNAKNIDLEFNINNIKDELIKLYSNFKVKVLNETANYMAMRFYMENMNMDMAYVILKNKFSQINSIQYISTLKDVYHQNISILVPKNLNHKTRRVIDNLKAKTTIDNVYFIDEFLFDNSLKKIKQSNLLTIDDFINPVIKEDEDIKHLPDILNWITEDRFPSIGIIKAPGGIGKTTLTEKIHDILIKDEENKFLVLFIAPHDFIENFKDVDFSEENEYDLYGIFKKCHPQGHEIDENTFYSNFSHGNILMIIDGVDEIISTVPSFSLDSFLKRLSQINKEIGKGKILITCRDIYIDDINYLASKETTSLDSIIQYQLLPFNETLANQYFSKHIESEYKIGKNIQLLNEFIVEHKYSEYKYPPFLLEIVLDFVLSNNANHNAQNTIFKSKYLLENHSNDFIIHQTFNREIVKKSDYGYDLSIDKQVAFFCAMAVDKNGVVDLKEIEEILSKTDHVVNLKGITKGLIDHPFLKKKDDNFHFNFKFLKVEFLIIGLYNLLKDNNLIALSENTLSILAYKFNYNSILSFGVLKKIELDTYFNSNDVINTVKTLITKIKKTPYNTTVKKKAVSNLFLLACEYCKRKNIHYQNGYLKLVSQLFSENNDEFISDFYLFDVPEDMALKIDFTNLYLQNSEIHNYAHFLECKFDAATSFMDSCKINNINIPTNFNIDNMLMAKSNFHDIIGDNSIHKILRLKEEGKSTIENDIRKFLKCFYTGRIINLEIPKSAIRKSFSNAVTAKHIIEALHEVNILTDISNSHFTLNKAFIGKINKFTMQGRSFIEINKAFRIILSNY